MAFHNSPTAEDHLNIKTVTALLLYNARTLLKLMEICVTNNNKIKIHPRGMATFKKRLKSECPAFFAFAGILKRNLLWA